MNQTIRNFSLLFPESDNDCFSISDTVSNDLSLEFFSSKLSESVDEKNRLLKILRSVPKNKNTISYRQEIYKDLKQYPDIAEKLCEIFDEMQYYIHADRNLDKNQSTIWEFISKLRSLQNYVHSVTEIQTLLNDKTFNSEGMKKLTAYIDDIYKESGFSELSDDLSNISEGVDMINSMTLGINLNRNLQPERIGILSFNKYRFSDRGFLGKFLSSHRKNNPEDQDLTPFTMVTHSELTPAPVMNNLTTLVEDMLSSVTRKLKKELNKYTDYNGTALAKLGDELIFYVRCINLEKKLTEMGMPCCFPDFSDDGTVFSNLYNIKLAVSSDKSSQNPTIVCNDVHFDRESTVLILTGPNRGGKTILTQALGLAVLMFQQGIFVPCSKAKIRICDEIFTHFPADENKTVTLGRLGEESERFNKIWEKATSESLILLNESFSTTSHYESLYIAKDVVKCLCCLGARTCFNTHMHELAENTNEFKSEKTKCGVASAVMGKRDSNEAFKIRYEKPDGKSYAQEIAAKYGITFEQLSKKFE